jgi:hypothetical protein
MWFMSASFSLYIIKKGSCICHCVLRFEGVFWKELQRMRLQLHTHNITLKYDYVHEEEVGIGGGGKPITLIETVRCHAIRPRF